MSPSGALKEGRLVVALGGFHIWRPHRGGRGAEKYLKFAYKQYIKFGQSVGGGGVKKSENFADVIYGSPPKAKPRQHKDLQNIWLEVPRLTQYWSSASNFSPCCCCWRNNLATLEVHLCIKFSIGLKIHSKFWIPIESLLVFFSVW